MITGVLGFVPILFIYVLIGLVAAQLTGGRDPLSFGHPSIIVLWPVAAFVATVGLLIFWVMPGSRAED